MAKTKKGLFTDEDRAHGLVEKKGELKMGDFFSNEDRKGLAEKKGLEMGSFFSAKDKQEGLM